MEILVGTDSPKFNENKMSEKFARTLIRNLNRKIRFAKSIEVKISLTLYRDAIIESMQELGHNVT